MSRCLKLDTRNEEESLLQLDVLRSVLKVHEKSGKHRLAQLTTGSREWKCLHFERTTEVGT